MAKRATLGDVFEISTPIGLAFAQFINTDERLGELIRVLPGAYPKRPRDLSPLVAGPERYMVFYPVTAAVRQRLVEVVDNIAIPAHAKRFPQLLIPGPRSREDYTPKGWALYDGNRETNLRELRPEHRNLSIGFTLLQQGLVNAIVNDWMPADEFVPGGVGFRKLMGGEPPTAKPTKRRIRAFWYTASEENARAASAEAKAAGYRSTIELDEDDPPRWGVIAEREAVNAPSLEDVDAFFERLAAQLDGEYDGHEVTV